MGKEAGLPSTETEYLHEFNEGISIVLSEFVDAFVPSADLLLSSAAFHFGTSC